MFSANPHYFERDGKPIVLVTSDHHYGAVLDADFDFGRYLDALAASGMNLTRIYPGGMFEVEDKYVAGNPLGPRPGRQVLPWARSTVPGAHPALAPPGQPSFKVDLDRWNPDYFARLRTFVEHAARRGIVVEVAFFNGMYADSWPLMAFHHLNNVQGVGRYEADECGLFTTRDPRNEDVLRHQKAYVARLAVELNGYDNVIYDLCDEPSLVGRPDGSIVVQPDAAVVPWLHALRDAFLEAERPLPKRHVLGQTVQNLSPDLSAEPWCDWLPTEYVRPAGRALERNYAARKPIVDVESDYYGHSLVKSPYTADAVRLEGWWFLLGGGAGVINLNGEYHRGQEEGAADTRDRILPQRKVLRDFVLRPRPRRRVALRRSGGPARGRARERARRAREAVRRLPLPRAERRGVGRALRGDPGEPLRHDDSPAGAARCVSPRVGRSRDRRRHEHRDDRLGRRRPAGHDPDLHAGPGPADACLALSSPPRAPDFRPRVAKAPATGSRRRPCGSGAEGLPRRACRGRCSG